jgi:hypothetical protein
MQTGNQELLLAESGKPWAIALHFSNKASAFSSVVFMISIGSTFVALPRAEMDKENVHSHEIYHRQACWSSRALARISLLHNVEKHGSKMNNQRLP